MSGAEKWIAIDGLDVEIRIDWLKRRCDWFTLASVTDDDASGGFAWEVVGTDEGLFGGVKQVFGGLGHTVSEAVADAMREVLTVES